MTELDDNAAPLEPGPDVAPELFREWRSPRFGASNPERLTNPVWDWLVRSRATAYAAGQRFGVEPRGHADPGWSFARFGQSATPLPDGRTVLIAGEHEDHYDSDFCIYNDVVVRYPDDRLEIFGYPRDEFPPTDFHSATLTGDSIVLIGGLGYPSDRRPGTTQVAALDLQAFSISLIPSFGDTPGWIHGHSATLSEDARTIVVAGGKIETARAAGVDFRDNGDDWRLDLSTWRWERLTDRRWRQWQFARADRRSNHLWRVRSLAQFRGVRWAKEHRDSMEMMIAQQVEEVKAAYGAEPDLDLFARVFAPPTAHESLPSHPEELGVHRIRVDGVVVRYVEGIQSVKMIVEGRLPNETCDALVADLRTKLASLERIEYIVSEL